MAARSFHHRAGLGMDAATRLATRFGLPVLNCASSMIPDGLMRRSLLCDGSGTDSEFTGGAAAWEVAADFLKSAAEARGLPAQLEPQSVCVSWLFSSGNFIVRSDSDSTSVV